MEYITQRSGNNAYSRHYQSNIKNDIWYQQILHIDEVTKTIVEDLTQVVSRMNYINNESDFHITKEEQIVYEVLQKKILNAIAVKEEGVYEQH